MPKHQNLLKNKHLYLGIKANIKIYANAIFVYIRPFHTKKGCQKNNLFKILFELSLLFDGNFITFCSIYNFR